MKNRVLYFVVFFLSFSLSATAQRIQASIGAVAGQPKRVKIYLVANASQTPATISTLQFNVGISTTVGTQPTVTVVSSSLPGVTAANWQVNQITEGGFYNYNILTAVSPIQFNTTAGTEFEAIEIEVSGGTATANDVRLVTLAEGGSNGNTLFLSTGTLTADGSNLYYARSGVTVNNQFSYDETDATVGTATSTATFSATLPVRFLSFSAVRQASNVAVNWGVGAEESVSSYELEVSTNGSTFVRVATKAGLGKTNYDYTDQGVARYNATKLYYRIKQIDRDGTFTYSPVKTVRLDVKGNSALYPNPVREGFTLNIPYLHANDQRVLLQLVNSAGQVLETRTINRAQAVNYYYKLQPSIPSGDYLLKIYEDGTLSETKQVLIKK
jgi:hypothetical protein